MSSGRAVIEIQGLTAGYGEEVILREVSFAVNEGEVFAVLGGSGCGKSTLLRHIVGLLPPRAGTVKVRGVDVHRAGGEETARMRRDMGVLFQSGALFGSMTVAENVALPMQEHTMLDQNIIDISVKIKLELVGLREHADKYPAQISGGMKKRAGLARALALDPKVLFYDEPSAGLDPVTSAEIDQLILDLTKKLGVTSVVVTHEMDSAFTIADRMCMLDKGKVLMVDRREAFAALRDQPAARLDDLTDDQQLIRQFLRGDAQGPLTRRKAATNYAEDLLGELPTTFGAGPAIEPTRAMK